MRPVYVFKLAVHTNPDNWERTEEQTARMIQHIIKSDGSLVIDSIQLQEGEAV